MYPSLQGSTNWSSPSYSPSTDMLYVPVREMGSIYYKTAVEYKPGTFYTGAVFPPTYQGAFFYADYASGWIKSVTVDGNNQLASVPAQFAGGISGPVQVETGPDGALWYLAIGSGELRRISFVGNYTPIQCPSGQFRAEYYNDNPSLDPLVYALSGAPAVQRCETAIDYDWGFGAPVSGIG